VLFGNKTTLAQRRVQVDPPSNPPAVCPCCPQPSHHHAENLTSTLNSDSSQSSTQDRNFEIEVYIFLGNKARDAGKYDEAEKQYRRALSIDPHEWRAHYGLGNILLDQAREKEPINKSSVDKAIAEYNLAVQYSKDKSKAELAKLHSDLAEAYLSIGETSKAQESVNTAIRLNSNSASAIRRQGNIYFVQQKFEDAIREYKRSLDIEPDNIFTHEALGAAYFSLKPSEFENAIQQYKEAVSLRPDYIMGYENIGEAYYQKGDWKNASEWLSKAVVERNPHLEEVRYKLIYSYCRSGQRNAAREQYEKLKKSNPNSSKVSELKRLCPDL
jgi:protein O-GlcNAc transferase